MNQEDRQNPPPKEKLISRRKWHQITLGTIARVGTAALVAGGYVANKRLHKQLRDYKQLRDSLAIVEDGPNYLGFTIHSNKHLASQYHPRKLDIYNNRIEMTIERGDRFVYKLPPNDQGISLNIPNDIAITLHDFTRYSCTLSGQAAEKLHFNLTLQGDVNTSVWNKHSSLNIEGLSDTQLATARQSLLKLAELYNKDVPGSTEQEIIDGENLPRGLAYINCGNKFEVGFWHSDWDERRLLSGKNGKTLDCGEVIKTEIQRYMKTDEWRKARESGRTHVERLKKREEYNEFLDKSQKLGDLLRLIQ